jgi:hypothetical protein
MVFFFVPAVPARCLQVSPGGVHYIERLPVQQNEYPNECEESDHHGCNDREIVIAHETPSVDGECVS